MNTDLQLVNKKAIKPYFIAELFKEFSNNTIYNNLLSIDEVEICGSDPTKLFNLIQEKGLDAKYWKCYLNWPYTIYCSESRYTSQDLLLLGRFLIKNGTCFKKIEEEKQSKPEFIYALKVGEKVKIGRSFDVSNRIKDLTIQYGGIEESFFIQVQNSSKFETELINRFRPNWCRKNTKRCEWFSSKYEDVVDAIKSISQMKLHLEEARKDNKILKLIKPI